MHFGRLTKPSVAAEYKTLQTGKGGHPGVDSSTSSATEGSGFGRPQQVQSRLPRVHARGTVRLIERYMLPRLMVVT
jgi:hypothetical protein